MVIRSFGFSLVELLVTMALLSMVVLIGSSAYGLFAQRWDGQLGSFENTMNHTRDTMLVQESLGNLIPFMAYGAEGQATIYFEGNRNGFVAVSSQSVFVANVFSVVRFSVKQNTDLTYDVWYEEWPMVEDTLQTVRQSIPFYPPVILFKSISDPEFGYFGWVDIQAKLGNGSGLGPQKPEWMGTLNSVASSVAPRKTRLRFKNASGSYELISEFADVPARFLNRYRGGRTPKSIRGEEQGEGESVDTSCYC